MSDRLFCPHCLGTEDQHAIWTPCPYALESYTEPRTPGWMIVAGIAGGLAFVGFLQLLLVWFPQ